MKRSVIIIGALLLAASLQPASAGLGENSSAQRTRCESQAAAKFSMWQWFSRRDFVQRCMSSTATSGNTKKNKKTSAN